jgi:hypothetical protein
MFSIPVMAGVTWSALFGTLETLVQVDELKIDDYSLTQSSLETVFLAFAQN